MAARFNYFALVSLRILGLAFLFSLFDIVKSEEKPNFNLGTVSKYSLISDSLNNKSGFSEVEQSEFLLDEKNKNPSLTLEIFADKQYDYDQNIYLAKGNAKVIMNGAILRADLISYDRLSNTINAEGNVRFKRRGQYLRGKIFKYNFIEKEGEIEDSFGFIDIDNVIEDLKLTNDSERLVIENNSGNDLKYNMGIDFIDGIQFAIGNIQLPENQITRTDKSIGSINNWRYKAKLISIEENGWKSEKMTFTNDPFDPIQISFEAFDVTAREEDDEMVITSSENYLNFKGIARIPIGEKRFGGEKKKKSRFELIFDGKDRDGLVLIRRNDPIRLNESINIDLKPQFLIQRALKGESNSYEEDNNTINFLDLIGLDLNIDAEYEDWKYEIRNDFSTLNIDHLFKGLRHSSTFTRELKSHFLNEVDLNVFTAYRFRAWNGTIGETEIKSAYGGFLDKSNEFNLGEIKNRLNFRIGLANYEAEKLFTNELTSLWRSSLFVSLDSDYYLWQSNVENLEKEAKSRLSPVLIKPELILRTKINSAYFNYEDGNDQAFIKLGAGPELRLGNLTRNFLDYTRISIMPGIKIKSGNSPFKFDNAIDLRTINLALTQQLYGPLILSLESNVNVDSKSDNYREYFGTKLGLLLHKRAYECGLYFHPNENAGGVYFRLNGFKFDNSVKAMF